VLGGLVVVLVVAAGCSGDDDGDSQASGETEAEAGAPNAEAPEVEPPSNAEAPEVEDFVYQLQGYADDGVDELVAAPQEVAVIDLARDGHDDWFTAEEIGELQASGKTVLAYFEIGSIEDFRPERAGLPDELVLNIWPDWPEEHWVRYWEPAWWDMVVRPRIDQALAAGFDGVYLDTPLAYENIDLSLVEGEDRDTLARKMVDLIVRISDHGKEQDPGFLVFPQNSPELRAQPGYVDAIDGLGVEELFFAADDDTSDQPCSQDWCAENLAHVEALRDAGKQILAVDYASDPENVATACERYADEGFAGYVTTRALDTITPPCP
jgi:cysteinyl-tRNA synthetase, unknown class